MFSLVFKNDIEIFIGDFQKVIKFWDELIKTANFCTVYILVDEECLLFEEDKITLRDADGVPVQKLYTP